MARPLETAALITQGVSPGQIAKRWGISIKSVMRYIYVAIGEGRIRQSDVLFAFDKNFRRNVESCLSKGKDLQEWELIPAITKTDSRYDSGDISIYLSYRNLRIYAGELYEFITDLERVLHEKIKSFRVVCGQTLFLCFAVKKGLKWLFLYRPSVTCFGLLQKMLSFKCLIINTVSLVTVSQRKPPHSSGNHSFDKSQKVAE
jgi:hypothetical protein